MIFLGDFSFVRIFLTENYRVTMTTSSVVGIPTGGTFIPRDISVGILKPRGCSYHCDTANKSLLHVLKMSHVFNIVLRYKDVMQRDIMIEPSVM